MIIEEQVCIYLKKTLVIKTQISNNSNLSIIDINSKLDDVFSLKIDPFLKVYLVKIYKSENLEKESIVIYNKPDVIVVQNSKNSLKIGFKDNFDFSIKINNQEIMLSLYLHDTSEFNFEQSRLF